MNWPKTAQLSMIMNRHSFKLLVVEEFVNSFAWWFCLGSLEAIIKMSVGAVDV